MGVKVALIPDVFQQNGTYGLHSGQMEYIGLNGSGHKCMQWTWTEASTLVCVSLTVPQHWKV